MIGKKDKNRFDKENITVPGVTPFTGLGGQEQVEDVPTFVRTNAEEVWQKGNSFIVLGKDRPGDESSTGGLGNASAIDIVVGRASFAKKKSDKAVHPNFGGQTTNQIGDAVRVYLTEKGNIDDYFKINTDEDFVRSKKESAIGLKADAIRIIGRQNIILTTDRGPVKKTSDGISDSSSGGIHLIAGGMTGRYKVAGEDELYIQPMVKGNNLKRSLRKLNNAISDVNILFTQFLLLQMQFNSQLMGVPYSSVADFGVLAPVLTNPGLYSTGIDTQVRTYTDVLTELQRQYYQKLIFYDVDDLLQGGDNYICSEYNKVN
jgi:hypothetical protein